METGLKGKTVLITGASRNIGALAAVEFAREGANLALCTSSKMDQLNEVAKQCDVANRASVQRFVDKTLAELVAVHVVINNAVDRGAEGGFLAVSDEVWEYSFRVNLG